MLENNHKIIIDGVERNAHVPASYGLFVRDHKIFLIRRANTGYKDGQYMVPAGHVEAEETYSDALRREVKEEAGVELLEASFAFVHLMNRLSGTKSQRADVFFRIDHWETEPFNNEPEKSDGADWFDLDNLPENTVDYLRFALDCIKKGEMYSEYGWN